MEDILDLYEKGYDFLYPIVCLDEKPYQLLKDILSPFPPDRVSRGERITHMREMEPVICLSFSVQVLVGVMWR
jgi:hypothetical protein